jgi:hypothetical protein
MLNAATIHQAVMALEEVVFLPVPVVHESFNTFQFGFVAADPRTCPEEIVKRHLGDRANIFPADVEPDAPVFSLSDRCIVPGLIDIDVPRPEDLRITSSELATNSEAVSGGAACARMTLPPSRSRAAAASWSCFAPHALGKTRMRSPSGVAIVSVRCWTDLSVPSGFWPTAWIGVICPGTIDADSASIGLSSCAVLYSNTFVNG